jgi:hypothetical protein
MKIDKIRIEKIKTWNKLKTIKKEWKQMKQGKGNTIKKILNKKIPKMKKPNKK